jgi:ubiquinone/menaquinone biosynthesis C-methylase UbiE
MPTGHRLFAAVWDKQSAHEPGAIKVRRKQVTSAAHGRVLEIGVGVGNNWVYLPPGIEYTGIDPDAYMLERARRRAAEQHLELDLQQLDVQSLPFPDDTFDTVFATLVFCSVHDASQGLREVYRVLKPDGEFRFSEHVRSKNRVFATSQHAIKPLWRHFAGGCEPDRDTLSAISGAGFHVVECEAHRFSGLPAVTGFATRAAAVPLIMFR